MSEPQLPTTAIETDRGLQARTEHWFEYPVKAQPHHTDYGGIVWHGTYLTWMEEARVEYLRSLGIDFAELVAIGCDFPVVEVALRYHRPIRLGTEAVIKTKMFQTSRVRIDWDYQIQSPNSQELFVTGRVTVVSVDREKGKIMRQLPAAMKDALVKQTTKS